MTPTNSWREHVPATVWAESQAGLIPMPDSEEFQDPYLDPETGILRNLISARTKETLDDAEGSLSFARLVQLVDRLPKPTGDSFRFAAGSCQVGASTRPGILAAR